MLGDRGTDSAAMRGVLECEKPSNRHAGRCVGSLPEDRTRAYRIPTGGRQRQRQLCDRAESDAGWCPAHPRVRDTLRNQGPANSSNLYMRGRTRDGECGFYSQGSTCRDSTPSGVETVRAVNRMQVVIKGELGTSAPIRRLRTEPSGGPCISARRTAT